VSALALPTNGDDGPSVSDGDRCRYHRRAMGWPGSVGDFLADDTAAHHACHKRPEVERVRRRAAHALAPGALADEAELTVRSEMA
jgi:hypothetical protein